MANTYAILSAVTSNGVYTITGTVNGILVTLYVLTSVINSFPDATSLKNFLAPLMLAAAGSNTPSVQTLGTFSQ